MTTLEALAAIGELVSAIAVLISLIYLAAQIRQNTQTVRASAYHEASSSWVDFITLLAGDAELAEIYHQGRVSPEALTREQLRRFDLLMDANLGNTENIFLQYRLGFLPQSNQDRFAVILRSQFASAGVREFWRRRRSFFTAEFVAYVEGELGLYAPEPPISA